MSLGIAAEMASDELAKFAQDKVSPYGKVLRYKIVSTPSGVHLKDRAIFSMGHRNPQGMLTYQDLILAVEHGPKGGDELNIIEEDDNYGWPVYSLGSDYDNANMPAIAPEDAGITEPIFAFVPSIGISDLTICPLALVKRYAGLDCVLVSSLRNEAFYIMLGDLKNRRVISAEKVDVGARVREIFIRNGMLFLVTDFGSVLRVEIDVLSSTQ